MIMVVDESFKQDLRSVLISEKHGINILRVNQQYCTLMGKNIEYDRRQYPTLEAFLSTLTDTCFLTKNYNQTIVHAVTTEKQLELRQLIRGQKSNTVASSIVGIPQYSSRVIYKTAPSRRSMSSSNSRYSGNYTSNNYSNGESGRSSALSERRPNENVPTSINGSNGDGYRRRRRSFSELEGEKENEYRKKPVESVNSNTACGTNARRDSKCSQNSRVFDIRARNGDGNIKVIELKPSDYIKKENSVRSSGESSDSRNLDKGYSSESSAIRKELSNQHSNNSKTNYENRYSSANSANIVRRRIVGETAVKCFDVRAHTGKLTVIESKPPDHADQGRRSPQKESKPSVDIERSPARLFADVSPIKEFLSKNELSCVKESSFERESTLIVTKESDEIIQMISQLIQDFEQIYDYHVEELFERTYNESLKEKCPKWLDLVDASPKFEVQRLQLGKNSVTLVGLALDLTKRFSLAKLS